MTRKLSILMAILVVAAISAGFNSSQSDAGEAEAEWARALVAADIPALTELYADDLIYVHSNGAVDTKEEWLGHLAAGRIRFSSAKPRNRTVRTYGNSAIVNALYDSVLNDTPMTIQYLTVFVNDGEGWRIVTQQTATLPNAEH